LRDLKCLSRNLFVILRFAHLIAPSRAIFFERITYELSSFAEVLFFQIALLLFLKRLG
jgi:hypothetical protein